MSTSQCCAAASVTIAAVSDAVIVLSLSLSGTWPGTSLAPPPTHVFNLETAPPEGARYNIVPGSAGQQSCQRNLCHETALGTKYKKCLELVILRKQGRAPKTQQNEAGKATGAQRPPRLGLIFSFRILYQCCNVCSVHGMYSKVHPSPEAS